MERGKARKWLVKYRGELTQQQVSDMAKLSRSYYTEIETGDKNPSVETAKRIAEVLDFDWTLFFKGPCREMRPTGTDGK